MSPSSTRRRTHVIPFGHPYSCTPILNQIFETNQSPSHAEVTSIMARTGLKRKQITSWFWRKRKEALDPNFAHQNRDASSSLSDHSARPPKSSRIPKKIRDRSRKGSEDDGEGCPYQPSAKSIRSAFNMAPQAPDTTLTGKGENYFKNRPSSNELQRDPVKIRCKLRPLAQRAQNMERSCSDNEYTKPTGFKIPAEEFDISPPPWTPNGTENYCQPTGQKSEGLIRHAFPKASPPQNFNHIDGPPETAQYMWPQAVDPSCAQTTSSDLSFLFADPTTTFCENNKYPVPGIKFQQAAGAEEHAADSDLRLLYENMVPEAQASAEIQLQSHPLQSGPSSRALSSGFGENILPSDDFEFSSNIAIPYGNEVTGIPGIGEVDGGSGSLDSDESKNENPTIEDYSNLLSSSVQDHHISSPNSSLFEPREADRLAQDPIEALKLDSAGIGKRQNSVKTLITPSFKEIEEDPRLFTLEEQLRDFIGGKNLFDHDDFEAFFKLTQTGSL